MKELIKTLWKHKIAFLIIIAVSIYNKILEIVTTMTGKRSPLIKDTLKGNLVCYSTIVIWIVLWVFLLVV